MKNIYLVVLSLLLSASISFGQNRVYAPELQTPENGAIDQMPQVLLNWYAVTGVGMNIQYEVQLATDDAFTNPVEFPLVSVTALDAANLMFGNTYYWHVRAHDGDEVSDWSETWSFSVVTTVSVTDPSDGGIVNPQVDIGWNPVAGVDFYQILVDTLFSWKHEFTDISDDINATFVVDANNYGGVGDGGLIFYYDGQWNIAESGTTKDLFDVYFVDANNGWAVGKTGTVLHFDGSTWSSVDIGTTSALNAVSFADANNGWIVGNGGLVYFYNGSGWMIQDTITIDTNGTTTNFNTVWAVSPTDVWAGGKSGYMAHYDGTSWSVDKPGTKDFMGLWFNAANDGWGVQKSGRVSHFDGSTWTEESTGVSKVFFGIAFNGSTGYIVGQTGTLLEYNNGQWNQITSGTKKNINGIWFAGGVGLYAGDDGIAYTYIGGDGFDSPYATTYNVSGSESSFSMHNLFFGSTYYYKMRMGHSADTSSWTVPRSFQVQRSPELKAPSDGASNIALEIKLDWKDFDGIQKFNVQIADNPEFDNAFTYYSDSSFFDMLGLTFGITYYWRVNAQNATGSSPWSAPWSFTTINTVDLTAPANNAVDVATCPLLEWEAIPGVGTYEVWVDTDENFTNPQKKTENGTSSQCQSQLEKKTDYFWKVRGIFAIDTSDWSPVWKFTTLGPDAINEIVDPASLTLFPNPSNGNFTVSLNSLVDDNIKIQVVSVSGKVIYKREFKCSVGVNKIAVDIDNLASGIYHVSIIKNNNKLSRKLVVR